MKLVSIIIPMYNSEKYVIHTLKSILEQTYTNYEVIIIDDCSTDNCFNLCKEFIKENTKFHLFQNNGNKGICYTRNYGLKMAKGDFIAFCDDDDIILPKFLEDNINELDKENACFIKFGRELIDVDKNNNVVSQKKSDIKNKLIFDNEELVEKFFEIKKTGVLINVWNGIYRKDIIDKNNLLFDTNMKYGSEDAKFSLEYLLVSKKLIINPENYYIHYRRVTSSTSKQFNLNKIYSLVETAKIESVVWEKINNQMEIICAKNAYIINIISLQLLNENCFYSNKNKINIIKDVSNKPHLYYDINFKLLFKILSHSRKQFFFTVLNKCRLYDLILYLISKEGR